MTTYVRARSGGVTMSNRDDRITLTPTTFLPSDHWAVVRSPDRFVPADLSTDAASAVDKLAAARTELAGLGGPNATPGRAQRADNLRRHIAKLEAEIAEATESADRAEQIRELAADPANIEAGNAPAPWAASRAAETHPAAVYGGQRGRGRSAALRSIDASHKSGDLPDHAAARAERLVSNGPVGQTDVAARWVEVTGTAEYRSAFAKLCADPDRGHLLWTPPEADAFRAVQAFATQYRAMATSPDSAGGFMVPYQLDPSITLTSDGSVSPIRRLARVVQTVTNRWKGVSSAGVTAEWKSEGSEAADATPTLAGPSIPVHMGDAFVPFSYEVGEDAVGFMAELQGLLVDAADQLQAAAFTNGSGTGEPKGIVTALTGTASEVSAGTAGSVSADDVVSVQNKLGPRFQPRAQWAAPLSVINALGALETANGALRFPEVGTGSLLRKPLNEASEIPGPGDGTTPAAALVYGDFLAGYTIVDRIGTTMELIPNLFGANRRPTGQRGALMRFRTGADVVAANAFRMLTA